MAVAERSPRDEKLLVDLMAEINQARDEVRDGRSRLSGPMTGQEQTRRMQQLVSALEDFADAASAAGVPLPYRYRDEIRMYRAIYPQLPRFT
jgi:hypothetical protein